MTDWLRGDEKCVLSMSTRHILEELVRRDWTIIFDNTESPKAGSPVENMPNERYQWIMRVLAPADMGGRLELFVSDTEALFEVAADQVLRYLRYLRQEYRR